jgi:hypothetical protein
MYLKGRIVLSFQNRDVLQIVLARGPGFATTCSITSRSGNTNTTVLSSGGWIDTEDVPWPAPQIEVPELVELSEIYGGGIRLKTNKHSSVISVPLSRIRRLAAHRATSELYSFVRADTGLAIESFRPRRLAESVALDLARNAVLCLDDGMSIPLESAREIWIESDRANSHPDMFGDHSLHDFECIDGSSQQDFVVIPRRVEDLSSWIPEGGPAMLEPLPLRFMVAFGQNGVRKLGT